LPLGLFSDVPPADARTSLALFAAAFSDCRRAGLALLAVLLPLAARPRSPLLADDSLAAFLADFIFMARSGDAIARGAAMMRRSRHRASGVVSNGV
jgi:hypothetical protein